VTCTVRGYPSLSKYMDTVEKNPEALKPDCCPKCQCSDLGPHGFYVRMTVRKDVDRLIKDVVHILRFQCDQCHKTFGALPEFISPRRWYLWCMQQAIIAGQCQGFSKAFLAEQYGVSRDTVYRWNCWFDENQDQYRKIIYSFNQHEGMTFSCEQYWLFRFKRGSLSQDMLLIYASGIIVP
jgi:hypothetical protein